MGVHQVLAIEQVQDFVLFGRQTGDELHSRLIERLEPEEIAQPRHKFPKRHPCRCRTHAVIPDVIKLFPGLDLAPIDPGIDQRQELNQCLLLFRRQTGA